MQYHRCRREALSVQYQPSNSLRPPRTSFSHLFRIRLPLPGILNPLRNGTDPALDASAEVGDAVA